MNLTHDGRRTEGGRRQERGPIGGCRGYRACAVALPAALGESPSAVSRRFIAASAKNLRERRQRRLDGYDPVALVLGARACAAGEVVITAALTGRDRDG